MPALPGITTSPSIAAALLLSISLSACTESPSPVTGERPQPAHYQANQATLLSKKLPRHMDKEALRQALPPILKEIARARADDMKGIYDAVTILAKQAEIVSVLEERYRQTPAGMHSSRLFLLQVMGQLKRNDALPFLKAVVDQPLPAVSATYGYSKRELEEMLHAKAVHGIAYLDSDSSRAMLLDIINTHASKYVRVEAIDAYMWNNDDSERAASELGNNTPPELQRYIGLPRFHDGMDAKAFDDAVSAWHGKWSNK